MKRSRFTEEQIIGILKEYQTGLGAKDLCCKHGVSDATFYKWRARFGGMEVSDAKKLKALEVENARLKKLLAEQMMDVSMLKEMLGRTSEAWCAAASHGPLPGRRFGQAKSAERRGHDTEGIPAAARLRFGWDRPRVYRRPPTRPQDADLRARLKDLSSERRRFGYPLAGRCLTVNACIHLTANGLHAIPVRRRLHVLLKRDGWPLSAV